MSQLRCIKRTQQRGDILLEALIGMLLLGIIGLGIAHVTSRVSVSQKDMNVHNVVVSTLRSELLAGNSIYSASIDAGKDSFTIKPHSKNITVTIEHEDVKVSMTSLSATKKGDDSYKICVGPIACND